MREPLVDRADEFDRYDVELVREERGLTTLGVNSVQEVRHSVPMNRCACRYLLGMRKNIAVKCGAQPSEQFLGGVGVAQCAR